MSAHEQDEKLAQARQTLTDYSAFLKAQLEHERARADGDEESLEELEAHYEEVQSEQQTLTPAIINKALTVYAPFLQAML